MPTINLDTGCLPAKIGSDWWGVKTTESTEADRALKCRNAAQMWSRAAVLLTARAGV
jgi:hypothetical protein